MAPCFAPPPAALSGGGKTARARVSARAAPPPPATPSPGHSALDAIPESLKLNAVAESLARSREVGAALAVAAELRRAGAPLEPRARAAIVDAIAASPGAAAAQRLGLLFEGAPPHGYGAAGLPPAGRALAHAAGGAGDASSSDVLPDSGRRVDMALAAGFLAVVGASVGAEVVEPLLLHHAATEATTVLMVVMGGLAFDRFAAAGHWWNRVSAGMDRLLSDDPAREAQVEAAYFLTAYLLGLPCAPFRPDVGQLLKLHGVQTAAARGKPPRRRKPRGGDASAAAAAAPSTVAGLASAAGGEGGGESSHPPLDDRTVERYLVWLMAGVAAESMMDGVLVESDAALAREFLRATSRPGEGRVVAAYASARRLLTRHQVLHAELADSMLAGLSAGECVNLLEKSLLRR
jgi:hypothetical protein